MIGSVNILVTIMYWAVEYNGSTDVVGVEVHSINTVFILTNHMMTAMPCQILHFIYPMLYLALYALFTYIYYACDGTNIKGRPVIYSVVDWGKAYPTAITVVVGILVFVPLVHLVLFAIYTFRIFLHSKINSETYSTGTHNQENSRNDETRSEMHEVPSGVEMRPIAVS
ncbi:protein rolling stone-like [Physella acuta]|uniref:protein rolling stone-like n=1 Tax=Physella acuta TaxID=109671 RepID=UPI0027DD3842|nr:protein rolling stone-like [Physella acuta]